MNATPEPTEEPVETTPESRPGPARHVGARVARGCSKTRAGTSGTSPEPAPEIAANLWLGPRPLSQSSCRDKQYSTSLEDETGTKRTNSQSLTWSFFQNISIRSAHKAGNEEVARNDFDPCGGCTNLANSFSHLVRETSTQ